MFSIFGELANSVIAMLEAFVTVPVAKFCAGIAICSQACLLVWGFYKGLMIMSGQVAEPFWPFMKDIMIKTFLMSFIVAAGVYNSYVKDNLFNMGESIAKDILQENTIFDKLDSNLNQLAANLDTTMGGSEAATNESTNSAPNTNESEGSGWTGFVSKIGKFFKDVGSKVAGAAMSLLNIGQMITTLIQLLLIVIMYGIMGYKIFVAILLNKIFFHLCIAVGPLFIFFACFERSKGWFSSWLSTTLGYGFSYPMIAITINGCMGLFENITAKVQGEYTASWGATLSIVLLCMIFSLVVDRVGEISSSLFGASNQSDNVANQMHGAGANSTFAKVAGGAVKKPASFVASAAGGAVANKVGGAASKVASAVKNWFKPKTEIGK